MSSLRSERRTAELGSGEPGLRNHLSTVVLVVLKFVVQIRKYRNRIRRAHGGPDISAPDGVQQNVVQQLGVAVPGVAQHEAGEILQEGNLLLARFSLIRFEVPGVDRLVRIEGHANHLTIHVLDHRLVGVAALEDGNQVVFARGLQ